MSKETKQFVIVKSLVINSKGQILFVKRKREWHKEAHNKWEFPGGKIEFGEQPEQTAIREVKEEAGYDIKVKSLLPKIISSIWEYKDRLAQQILICYICKLVGGKSSLGDHGVSEIKWFTPTNLPKEKDCLPGTIDFLKEYLK